MSRDNLIYLCLAVVMIVTLGVSLYGISLVRDEINLLRQTVDTTGERAVDAVGTADTAIARLDSLLDIVERVQRIIDELTTEEINNRLDVVNGKIDTLTGKLDVLERIINPDTAEEILNIARLSQEIAAREKFEQQIRSVVSGYDARLEGAEARVWELQITIVGGLVAIIVTLIGGFAWLDRRGGSKAIQ